MSGIVLEPATDPDFQWLLGQAAATRQLRVAPDLAPAEVLEIIRHLPANWLMLAAGELVGIISLKSDADGEVEVGYGVAQSRWARGLASSALAALLPILRARGVRLVRAETSIGNPASQRVLERNGFTRAGERIDEEDGPLILWRREL